MKVSKKHGLNPSIMQCFYCMEDYAVALLGRLKGDIEAPHSACYDTTPCPKCEDFMKQGIILVSVRDGEQGENPYRTGGWCVIREEALYNVLDKDLADTISESRFAFVPDSAWDALGLPRGDNTDRPDDVHDQGDQEPQ